jgi:hypothetical protein
VSDALAEIATDLSNAAPYAGAIEALANLGIDITKLITPDQAQQYANERKARLQKAAELVSELLANPSPGTEQRLNDFDDQLCLDAGFPLAGGVAEPTITIRVSRYLAHVGGLSAGVEFASLFNELAVGPKPPVAAATPVGK